MAKHPSKLLDPEPFAEWLTKMIEQDGLDVVAARLGVNDRMVWAYAKGRHRINISTVDKYLTRHDGAMTLRDLYPEVYEFDDPALNA